MSITTIIHEPPVTFGMLPVGTTLRTMQGGIHGMRHGPRSDGPMMRPINCTDCVGTGYHVVDDEPVDVLALPPGATLARKPKVVYLSDIEVDNWFRSAVDPNMIGRVHRCLDSGLRRVFLAEGGMMPMGEREQVTPCRVEVHVYPEYE
jgi:hypothetical protein